MASLCLASRNRQQCRILSFADTLLMFHCKSLPRMSWSCLFFHILIRFRNRFLFHCEYLRKNSESASCFNSYYFPHSLVSRQVSRSLAGLLFVVAFLLFVSDSVCSRRISSSKVGIAVVSAFLLCFASLLVLKAKLFLASRNRLRVMCFYVFALLCLFSLCVCSRRNSSSQFRIDSVVLRFVIFKLFVFFIASLLLACRNRVRFHFSFTSLIIFLFQCESLPRQSASRLCLHSN